MAATIRAQSYRGQENTLQSTVDQRLVTSLGRARAKATRRAWRAYVE